MPTRRVEHVDLPYAGRRHSPDYSRLSALYTRGGEVLADIALRKGDNAARMYGQLAGLFTNYHETGRQQKASEAATALRREERLAAEKLTRDEMAERKAERLAAAKLILDTKAESEAKDLVMDTPVGPISDTDPRGQVLAQALARFPSLRGRFSTTERLPATPLAGEMVDAPPLLTRTPTGVESRQIATDVATQAERLAAEARAKRDDVRADRSLELADADRDAMRVITQQNANRDRTGADVVVETADGPQLVDKGTGVTRPITGPDGKAVKSAPSAMERMDARKFSKAGPVIDSLDELSEKINTGAGLVAAAKGEAAKQAAKVNYDDDVAEYQSIVEAFAPIVARALGHTGVLTELDVQSAKALFAKPGNSKTLRDRKKKRLHSLIDAIEAVTSAEKTSAAPADPLGLGLPPKPKS